MGQGLTGLLNLEVLVLELGAVDGLAAGAVAVGEVAALEHELRDHAVERAALVRELLARLAHALLAGAKRTEVLDSLGNCLAVCAHKEEIKGKQSVRVSRHACCLMMSIDDAFPSSHNAHRGP